MEQNLRTGKTGARPSHEAIENKVGSNKLTDQDKKQKMDKMAMQGAKRAENRIHNNEEISPDSKIFSK